MSQLLLWRRMTTWRVLYPADPTGVYRGEFGDRCSTGLGCWYDESNLALGEEVRQNLGTQPCGRQEGWGSWAWRKAERHR